MELTMMYLSQRRSFYEKPFSGFSHKASTKSERNLKVALLLLKEII